MLALGVEGSCDIQIRVNFLQELHCDLFLIRTNKLLKEDDLEATVPVVVLRVVLGRCFATTSNILISQILCFKQLRGDKVEFNRGKPWRIDPSFPIYSFQDSFLIIHREVILKVFEENVLELGPDNGLLRVGEDVLTKEALHVVLAKKRLKIEQELEAFLIWYLRERVVWFVSSNLGIQSGIAVV